VRSTWESFFAEWLPPLEAEMRQAVGEPTHPGEQLFYGMLMYHLGWADAQLRPARVDAGKRIRPMLCLLACAAGGGDPAQALPAAAAIELLHNFSLIHDDIQDRSETRRGRPTVWALWGVAQAINAGDALFVIAHGEALGMAFQVQDDLLGIWGDPAVTGKPVADDLRVRKKTLPVIYAMERAPGFAERYHAPDTPLEVLLRAGSGGPGAGRASKPLRGSVAGTRAGPALSIPVKPERSSRRRDPLVGSSLHIPLPPRVKLHPCESFPRLRKEARWP